jgi:hypothetical protein
MRGSNVRSTTRNWARIAMKLGLLATDPHVWADVNERLSSRMEDMTDSLKDRYDEGLGRLRDRYDEGLGRLKDARDALQGNNRWVGPTVGLLGGVALGAGIALLFAPQSGEETRAAIQDAAVDMKERVRDRVSSMSTSPIRSSAAS